jgi:RNA polymerase sigma factor (sigma-70 family)
MPYTGKSEKEIIEGCKRKDRDAQNCLYKSFYGKMNAASYRYTGSFDDAKDIVHDSFIQVFDKILSFDGSGPIESWIRRIVINKSIDFLNKKNKFLVNISEEEGIILNDKYAVYLEQSNAEDIYSDVDLIYYSGITKDDILKAVSLIKDDYKVIFNLSVLDGYSHKTIAETLNISEESSRIRLKRARTAIQKILIESIKNKNR